MYKLNENQKKRINIEMLAHDHKICDTNFFETTEYKQLASEMIGTFPKYKCLNVNYKNCSKLALLNAGKYVVDKHTYGTDTRVRYVDMDSLTAELYAKFGETPKEEKYDEIIKYIDDNVDLIKVTNVPVELDMTRKRNGHAYNTWFYGRDDVQESFFKKMKPAIKKLSIEGLCNDDSKCTYVHEMYHALPNSHKGSIENLLNTEVLSIYMEKIASSELDPTRKLEKLEELTRILNTKNDIIDREHNYYNDIDELDRLRIETYILSTAIATALYDTYQKGNKEIKKEIDDSINGIFREEHTLEDVLQQYDATPERGSNIMRRHIKKLSK